MPVTIMGSPLDFKERLYSSTSLSFKAGLIGLISAVETQARTLRDSAPLNSTDTHELLSENTVPIEQTSGAQSMLPAGIFVLLIGCCCICAKAILCDHTEDRAGVRAEDIQLAERGRPAERISYAERAPSRDLTQVMRDHAAEYEDYQRSSR